MLLFWTWLACKAPPSASDAADADTDTDVDADTDTDVDADTDTDTDADTDTDSDTDTDTDTGLPPLVELCDNGVDDDLDAWEDCLDYDCLDALVCTGLCGPEDPYEDNDTPATATVGLTAVTGAQAHHQDPDHYALGTVAPGESVFATVETQGSVAWVRVLEPSGAVLAEIVDATSTSLTVGWLNQTASPVPVVLGVGVYSVGTTGCVTYDFQAEVGVPPLEDCDQPGDEDLDGASNCSDFDCAGLAACLACVGEDPYEPNDTPAQALPLVDDDALAVIAGHPDHFLLDIPAGEAALVRVALDGSDSANVVFRDSQGSVLALATGAPPLERTATLEGPDTLQVEVAMQNLGCAAYAVETATWTVGAEVCDDGLDNDLDGWVDCQDYACVADPGCLAICPAEDALEDNDDASTAIPITTAPGLGSFNEDVDWFRVEALPGEVVNAWVEAGAPARVELWTEAGTLLRQLDGQGTLVISTPNGLQQGAFHLRVAPDPDVDACVPYDLVELSATTPAAEEDCARPIDADGDFLPGCLDLDCAGAPGCSACAAEDALLGANDADHPAEVLSLTAAMTHIQAVDHYRIELPVGQLAIIGATPEVAGTIELQATRDGNAFGLGNPGIVSNDGSAPSVIEVAVAPDLQDVVCATYDWSVQLEPLPDEVCDDTLDDDYDGRTDCDDYDCNDAPGCGALCIEDALGGGHTTPATALPLADHDDLMVHAQQPDVFELVVPAGQQVTIDASFVHADGDIQLLLLDGLGVPVSGSFGNVNTESVTRVNPTGADQTWYLRVFLGDQSTCNRYDIHTSGPQPIPPETCANGADDDFDGWTDCADLDCAFTSSCACPAQDAFAPNQDPDEAATGVFLASTLAVHAAAADHFAYTLSPGELFEVEITGSDVLDLSLELADGTAVQALDDVTQGVLSTSNTGSDPLDVLVVVRTGAGVDCTTYDLAVLSP